MKNKADAARMLENVRKSRKAVSITEDADGITVKVTGHAYRNLKRLTKAQNRQLDETFTPLEVITTLLEPVIALADSRDLAGIILYNICGERQGEFLNILSYAAFEGNDGHEAAEEPEVAD